MRFQTPFQTDDIAVLEFAAGNGLWVPPGNAISGSGFVSVFQEENGVFYGAYITNVNSTDVDVFFARYRSASGTFGAAGLAWAAGGNWRVRKAKASSPVGFGLAKTGESGLINYYYEDDTTLAACTFQGNAGGSASASVAIKITRIGRVVTLDIPSFTTVVPTTGSVALFSNTNLPTWARPTTAKSTPSIVHNNGAYVTTPGYLYINTSGRLEFYRDIAGTAYTNSANAGWYLLQITYTV